MSSNIFTLPSHVSMLSTIVLKFTSSKYVRMANCFVGRRSRDFNNNYCLDLRLFSVLQGLVFNGIVIRQTKSRVLDW